MPGNNHIAPTILPILWMECKDYFGFSCFLRNGRWKSPYATQVYNDKYRPNTLRHNHLGQNDTPDAKHYFALNHFAFLVRKFWLRLRRAGFSLDASFSFLNGVQLAALAQCRCANGRCG